MAFVIGFGRAVVVGLGFVALTAPDLARAQVLPEPAEISSCLCLQQAVATLSADMNAKMQALNAAHRELANLDAELARQRAAINVNNPDSVARYKALLERRDGAYHQSIGPIHANATQATARYNARVSEYNQRCANRPFNSALVAQVQAHLMCPPLQ